jgi:hypothetical protein
MIFEPQTGPFLQKRKESCAWPRNLYLPRGKEKQAVKFRLIAFVHKVADNVNEGADPNIPGM